jgi:hypothetical protein
MTAAVRELLDHVIVLTLASATPKGGPRHDPVACIRRPPAPYLGQKSNGTGNGARRLSRVQRLR